MPASLYVYLSIFVPLIIHTAGFIICLGGFLKTRRPLFLYAAFYFGVSIFGSWSIPLSLFPGYPFSQSFLFISNYINLGLMFITLLAMAFMVHGFYRETKG